MYESLMFFILLGMREG